MTDSSRADEDSAWGAIVKGMIDRDKSASEVAAYYREKYGCENCGRVLDYDEDDCPKCD